MPNWHVALKVAVALTVALSACFLPLKIVGVATLTIPLLEMMLEMMLVRVPDR